MLTDSGVLDSSDFADDQALVASDVGPGIKRRLTLDPDVNLRLYSMFVPTRLCDEEPG